MSGIRYEMMATSEEMRKPMGYHVTRLLDEMKLSGIPEEQILQVLRTFVQMVIMPQVTAKAMVRFARREPWVFKCNPASRSQNIMWQTLQDIYRKDYPYFNG